MRRILSLLLPAALVLCPATPAITQSAQSPPGTPTLAERLDRLAAEVDRNRIDLHVPGAALAIVREEEVIFARGFGLADVEKNTSVTPETRFFIGSTTKAFTATLVGMLVDEGRMQWDDPVEKYLPGFVLKVQSKDPNDRATLRDVLSHRTGFTRMPYLDVSRGLSSDEILRRVSSAEPMAPFRQQFLYNNEHYVAAGLAAGAAAGISWQALVKTRLLDPLGMTATRTSMQEAWNDARTARGYQWDEATQKIRPLLVQSVNVDGLAPAGAISSTALDMTSWLRFQLRGGVLNGKALISPASLSTTRTAQISLGGSAGYGMGWQVRDWHGQKLVAHDGAVGGFSAYVGFKPDSKIGFVLLSNTTSALPAIASQILPQYLLGELPSPSSAVTDLRPYLGRYIANFAGFSNEVFTVSERNGRLVFDMPSKLESALNPPRADGTWPLVMNEQLAVSFDRDSTGRVVGLKLHEAGIAYEVPRESVVFTPEIPISTLQKYVGRYADSAGAAVFDVFIRNQRLAVRLPNNSSFDLLPPDPSGRRSARPNVGVGVTFEESPAGEVSAMNFQRPGGLPVMRLTPVASTLPTVDEIMTLRHVTSTSATATMRTSGTVRLPQSAVQGRFSTSIAGDDQLRTDLDLDVSVQIHTVMSEGRASVAANDGPSSELAGKALAQMRLTHPMVLMGDWRKYYDTVRVIRAGAVGGRKVWGIQLESAGLPAMFVALDAETGDVLQTQQTTRSGEAAIQVTTAYSDYREVGGMRVPHRYITSSESAGRAIFQVEKVEVGVTFPPDTFMSR